jgi:Skp family chaperone for outer membrane proteins
MSIETDIKAIIDNAARSGALTPEAIRQFDQIRVTAEKLEQMNDDLAAKLKAANTELSDLKLRMSHAQEKVRTLEKSVETYKKLEFAFELNKAMMVFEQDRRKELREIIKDVFRNIQVRETMIGRSPPATSANPSYYPPETIPVSSDTTRSDE